ncbi:MAG: aconitase X catalytic domain-containing protein [Longimicrobiales bacterium]|nr:aconitase X catalytic domain-containing protein [Longimicrobiales bacterium]
MTLQLDAAERDLLGGAAGEAAAMAMRVVVSAAEMLGAGRLVEISSSHIDGCLYHGDGGVEFAERLVKGGGRVAVPTTLNVGALDLLHPGVVRSDARSTEMARRQMDAYVALGARPTFTCAPYQVGHEPAPGEQVAWGESNAIAFVNSVLGARTERYGDFLDACCALTARAPLHGLHLEDHRRATVVVDVSEVPGALKSRDVFYPVLGTWLGLAVGEEIAVFDGLPRTTTRDQLKALGAAAASSGAVALFHVAGVTPEAATVEAALTLGSDPSATAADAVLPARRVAPTARSLRAALDRLSTATDVEEIDAVAVGSPHASADELARLAALVRGRRVSVPFYVCTARGVLERVDEAGVASTLREAGIEIVVDTCVVVTPILPASRGVLMTDSGKFAHYGPSNTGYDVVYGSLEDCVASALSGRVVRDEEVWRW